MQASSGEKSNSNQLNYKNFGKTLVQRLSHFPDLNFENKIEMDKDLLDIQKNFEADFFSNIRGHFAAEDLESLIKVIIEKIAEQKKINPSWTLKMIYEELIVDFHRSKYWGLALKSGQAPPVPLTEEQKNQWELWTYIWALVQSTIVLKFVIYYFGIRAAEDQDSELKAYMYFFIFLSFFSLFHFAYRKWKKEKNNTGTKS